ncbi:hypothetical protein L6R53_26060 [Myxococcota bacterium]|nr:hypothetical protein [Myxococcota bacterium]
MVGVLVLSLLLGCPREARCPAGSAEDPARLARLSELAGRSPRGPVCFGVGAEPALLPGAVARLDASWPDAAAAARLAHLWEHLPPPAPAPACAPRPWEQEARAWHAELLLRRSLGAIDQAGRPPFTQAWLADPRPETVAAWLRTEAPAASRALSSPRTPRCSCC